MAKPWITPNFKVFDVNGECTAYAGARPADAHGRGVERETQPTTLNAPAEGALSIRRSRRTITLD